MATIRKREGKWQALVRRHGSRKFAKPFVSRKSAEQWARQMEVRLESGLPEPTTDIPFRTFAVVIHRYETEVSRQKRGHATERYRLKVLAQFSLD